MILGTNPGEPLSTRAARMKIYNDLISQLDSGGAQLFARYERSRSLRSRRRESVADDPDGDVLVHLGSANYLDRYKIYVSHLKEWRQQFDKLESVDLRYDRQIVVNPDLARRNQAGYRCPSRYEGGDEGWCQACGPDHALCRNVAGARQKAPAARAASAVKPAAAKRPLKAAHQKAPAK